MNTKIKARLEADGGQYPAVKAGPSTSVWKRLHARIDYGRLTVCLRQVLRRSEEKGEALNPYTVAQRVYERYCRSLPREESKPSLSRFRTLISLNDNAAPPQVLRELESSAVVEGNAVIDRALMVALLQKLLSELERKGEILKPHRVAFLTYDRYVATFPESEARPHPSVFRKLISLDVKESFPQAREILKASRAVRGNASIDRNRMVGCLHEVLKEAEERNEKLTPRRSAELAHERYIANLRENGVPPSLSSFRNYITLNEKTTHPQILQILKSSPAIDGQSFVGQAYRPATHPEAQAH